MADLAFIITFSSPSTSSTRIKIHLNGCVSSKQGGPSFIEFYMFICFKMNFCVNPRSHRIISRLLYFVSTSGLYFTGNGSNMLYQNRNIKLLWFHQICFHKPWNFTNMTSSKRTTTSKLKQKHKISSMFRYFDYIYTAGGSYTNTIQVCAAFFSLTSIWFDC